MSNIKYIGQKPIFNRKFLADICKNLKNFGVGRIVYNEKETKYPEPCYYIIRKSEPHMSTEENTRIRVQAERIFRGVNMGVVDVNLTHFPAWTLVNKSDESLYLNADHTPPAAKTIKNVYDYPPALAEYLKRKYLNNNHHPKMLIKPPGHPTKFTAVNEPSDEVKSLIFPPYEYVTKKGLMINCQRDVPNSYYIKISKYPGLKWKVLLKPKGEQTINEKLGLGE